MSFLFNKLINVETAVDCFRHTTVPLDVNTSRFVPHSRLITGFVSRFNTTGTSGTGTAYPSGAPEFTTPPLHRFLVGFVLLDLQFYVYVLQIVVCHFVIFLLAVALSVLLRYKDSYYPFGIFKLFLPVGPHHIICYIQKVNEIYN